MPPKEKAKSKKGKAENEREGPTQPNKAKYNEKIDTLSTEITKIQGEQEALKAQLQSKSGKNEFFDQRNALQCEIQLYIDRISAIKAQKQELTDGLVKNGKDRRAAINELKKTEEMYQCKTEEQLDDYVQQLTLKHHTNVMSLQDEKRLIQEIQVMKKQKPQITAAAKKIDQLKTITDNLHSSKNLSVKDQIAELTAKSNEAWEAKEAVKRKRDGLDAAWDEKNKGTKEIDEKLQALREKAKNMALERTQLRDALREEEKEFWRYEQEQRRLRQEKRDAERAAQRAEWEKVQLERDTQQLTTTMPHMDEIYRLEQSITFLKSLLPKKEVEEKKNHALSFDNPEGSVVLLNKKNRDAECFFNAKKKCPTKKNRAPKAAVIKHNAETFRVCEFLNIKVPNTVDQIPDTLEELETQLEKYQALVKEWQRKLDNGSLMKEFLENRKSPQVDA